MDEGQFARDEFNEGSHVFVDSRVLKRCLHPLRRLAEAFENGLSSSSFGLTLLMEYLIDVFVD